MGVEFGPWVREFVVQIRRHWFIPYAAAQTSGHVVVVVRVGRDGRIESPSIKEPSTVAAFNDSALNAIAGVRSTAPLPAEYPSDYAEMTVTFYFGESPQQREPRAPGDGSTRPIGRDVCAALSEASPMSTPTNSPAIPWYIATL
jgi:TonB family protein